MGGGQDPRHRAWGPGAWAASAPSAPTTAFLGGRVRLGGRQGSAWQDIGTVPVLRSDPGCAARASGPSDTWTGSEACSGTPGPVSVSPTATGTPSASHFFSPAEGDVLAARKRGDPQTQPQERLPPPRAARPHLQHSQAPCPALWFKFTLSPVPVRGLRGGRGCQCPFGPQGPPRVADAEDPSAGPPAAWPPWLCSPDAQPLAHLRPQNFLDCIGRRGQSHRKETVGLAVCIF